MTSSRRNIKPEKPRPLKMNITEQSNTMELVLAEMDKVSQMINTHSDDKNIYVNIISLCENLKMFGAQLEKVYKDQLDRCFIALRNGCRDDVIHLSGRFRLLEVIELRAMHWQPNENLAGYYKNKVAENDSTPFIDVHSPAPLSTPPPSFAPFPTHSTNSTPTLGPGEVLKNSGKFKPTRVPGKNILKDEVVIRNPDSGKVMGIKGRRVHMIEELSETVISFQRVSPGARERLVQITGQTEEQIRMAKQLMEETIRRNSSPVRSSVFSNVNDCSSLSSQGSDDHLGVSKNSHKGFEMEEPIGEYRYTVTFGQDSIRITGSNLDLVRTAKLILEEHFKNEDRYDSVGSFTQSGNVNDDSEVYPMDCSSGDVSTNSVYSKDNSSSQAVNSNDSLVEQPAQKVSVIRQPLIPSSPISEIETAQSTSKEANARRANFAKTSEERADPCVDSQNNKIEEQIKANEPKAKPKYHRTYIAKCADSQLSKRTPKTWATVIRSYPTLVKKSSQHLSTIISLMNDRGDHCINDAETYLNEEDLFHSKDILAWQPDWTVLRQGSHEDESNGN